MANRLRTYAVITSLLRADGLTRCYRVSIRQRARLEHAVVVGGFLRDRLDHVPMLDHLAVLELENVDDGVAARARLAHGMEMDDDVIAVGEDALDLAAVVRELVLQEGDEALEAFPAVGGQRIVLGIASTEILRGFLEVLLVDRGVVEGGDDLLVLLHLPGVGGNAAGLAINSEKAAASSGRTISTSCVEAVQTHGRDGSHNAMAGKAIRITSRMRSVAMKGNTPAKMVEKFMSWITLFITKTTIPTGGWMSPSSTVITMMTPNQIGSKPSSLITGKMIGTVRITMASASIRHPSTTYMTMISASTP